MPMNISLVFCVALASNAYAGNMSCKDTPSFGSRMACYAITGTILLVGGSVVGANAAMHAITPGTDVKVELDDGNIVPGVVTAKAASGRVVKSGDNVRLDCKGVAMSGGDNAIKQCRLRFLRKDPHGSLYPRNHELFGVQGDWSIVVDKNGTPDETLLKLIRSDHRRQGYAR